MSVSDEGGYVLKSFQQATPKEQRDVRQGKWAEISIPYHTADEREPICGFLVFVVGKPHHELAILEMASLDANKKHLYDTFREFALPFFDWDWETAME